MKTSGRLFKHFTLIELLVVVAIILVLAGLLLPTLKSVKETGKKIKCLSSLKALGLASFNYSTENNGYLPMIGESGYDGQKWNDNQSFYTTVGVRYGSWGMWDERFLCPNMDNITWNRGFRAVRYSYDMNGFGGTYCGTDSNGPSYTWLVPRVVNMMGIKSPSERFLFRESLVLNLCQEISPSIYVNRSGTSGWLVMKNYPGTLAVPYRHNNDNGCNLVFADGHAVTKDSQDLVLNLQSKYRDLYNILSGNK